MTGRLEVICGPMYSGKSEELMRRLRRAQIAGKKVGLFKPIIDTRYKADKVVSHAGREMDCMFAERDVDLYLDSLGYDIVGVDEFQFITGQHPAGVVRKMAERQQVIISGLDMTFRREPFGDMPELLAVADSVDKLTAICTSCGQDATLTQRLVDGKPASFQGPTVQVGGTESYEARCRRCYRSG